MARVVLAMSGGVDSSVAAHLLREAGHEVVGLFMRHGVHADAGACRVDATARRDDGRPQLPVIRPGKQGCCSAADAEDARRVAQQLGIPFYVLNFEEEFDSIVDYFVREYADGRTPNPCIVCNDRLKFGKLFEYADTWGADFVATGHYARVQKTSGGFWGLFAGLDATKDQSYVLFGIPRERLARIRFPVGEHSKEAIRRLASRIGLRVADKPDSQEICFVPDGDHAALVRRRRAADTSGEIVTTDGRVVGRHDGWERFTVGQRKGLGIPLGRPYYVVRLEPKTRRVVLGSRDDLATRELTACRANWLIDPPTEWIACQAKIRYRAPAVPAHVQPLAERRLRVVFDQPCYAVAPGQAVVCYQGDRVIAGGWIERPEESEA
ncbi:MAG: tRNA 2-thiouridine(34) synthase MnmA [Thermogutta sp.]